MEVIYQYRPKKPAIFAKNLITGKAYKCTFSPNSQYYLDKILIAVNYADVYGVWVNGDSMGVFAKLTNLWDEFEFEEFNCELLEVV